MRQKMLDYFLARGSDRDNAEYLADTVLWCREMAKDQPALFREALDGCGLPPVAVDALRSLVKRPNESYAKH